MADALNAAPDPWFQSLFADRVGGANYGKGTEIYKFEKIKRAKRKALAEHPERQLLDFGIGENDDMADPLVRNALKREVDQLENSGQAMLKRQFSDTPSLADELRLNPPNTVDRAGRRRRLPGGVRPPVHLASGSGRSWNFTTLLVVPLPPSR